MSANKFTIKAFHTNKIFQDNVSIDQAKSYTIDLTAWAEENNNITTATWSNENGTASISNESLTSNIISALITFTNSETNLIKVVLNTGTQTLVLWIKILVDDPERNITNDYNF